MTSSIVYAVTVLERLKPAVIVIMCWHHEMLMRKLWQFQKLFLNS